MRVSAVKFLALVLTLGVFFVLVFPANLDALRTAREYGHATNAVMTFVAFGAVAGSVLCAERPRRGPDACD